MAHFIQVARCALFAALLSAAGCTTGQAADSKPKIDAKSQTVIDAWSKFSAAMGGFAFDSKISLVIEQQANKQSQDFQLQLSAERPNKLAFAVEANAQNGASVVSDGQELTVYIKGFQKYGVDPAPPTFEAMLQNPLVVGPMNFGNAAVVTLALLDDNPAQKLLAKVDTVEYGGLEEVDGVKCHLLVAAGPELDWKLWIDAGKQPLARKLVPDLAKAFAKMSAGNKGRSPFEGVKITNTVTFTDWQVDPKFAPETFAFSPPEGAERVDSLMELLAGGRPQQEPGPHPLVGQPAPEAKLDLLAGGHLDLAGLKGKKVVILDFWATWCGPCVQAMPIIEKVAAKFQDQGVALYAVNLQEEPEEITKFLEEAKLKVDVALDKEGAVARSYLAEAIPQTVIVGKDGTVQVVKVGFSPNLEAELTRDLEALLSGKDVAAATLKAAEEKKTAAAKAAPPRPDPPSETPAKKPGLNISIDKSSGKKAGK